MQSSVTQQHLRPSQASGESVASPRPPDHSLARSFLSEIAAPFGDRNPKGSATRILNVLAQASLEEAEVLLCLESVSDSISKNAQGLEKAIH